MIESAPMCCERRSVEMNGIPVILMASIVLSGCDRGCSVIGDGRRRPVRVDGQKWQLFVGGGSPRGHW